MASQPAGPIVDAQQVTINLAEGDLVGGVVVIAKIHDADGGVRLACSWSDGMTWFERLGMLRAAERLELPASDPGSWTRRTTE